MSWRLQCAAVLVVGTLAYGLWQRMATPGFGDALRHVTDGDADCEERVVCLRILVAEGVAQARTGAVEAGLVAAMAAVELGDDEAFDAVVAAIGAATPFLPGAPAAGATGSAPPVVAALGQPYLHDLMLGFAAENRGEPQEAARHFARVRVAAPLYGVELAASLAAEGLERAR